MTTLKSEKAMQGRLLIGTQLRRRVITLPPIPISHLPNGGLPMRPPSDLRQPGQQPGRWNQEAEAGAESNTSQHPGGRNPGAPKEDEGQDRRGPRQSPEIKKEPDADRAGYVEARFWPVPGPTHTLPEIQARPAEHEQRPPPEPGSCPGGQQRGSVDELRRLSTHANCIANGQANMNMCAGSLQSITAMLERLLEEQQRMARNQQSIETCVLEQRNQSAELSDAMEKQIQLVSVMRGQRQDRVADTTFSARGATGMDGGANGRDREHRSGRRHRGRGV